MVSTTALTNTIHGDMIVPVHDFYIGRALQLYGEYAVPEIEIMKLYIKEGDTAIDIGANIGTHTLGMSALVGEHGQVIAFEPQHFIYDLLLLNTKGKDNILATDVPLSDNDEDRVMGMDMNYGALGNYGANELKLMDFPKDSAMIEKFCTENKFIEELKRHHTMKLDTYFRDYHLTYPDLSYIKIDVEGMEEQVLRGAENVIFEHQPVMYIENDRKNKSRSLIRFLKNSLKYTCYWHIVLLYNPDNFKKNVGNIYGATCAVNMVCLPAGYSGPRPEVQGRAKVSGKEIDRDDWHPIYGELK